MTWSANFVGIDRVLDGNQIQVVQKVGYMLNPNREVSNNLGPPGCGGYPRVDDSNQLARRILLVVAA